jgi:hypothetical protein
MADSVLGRCHLASHWHDNVCADHCEVRLIEIATTPALSQLVTAFNAAVSADVSAENSPGDIGGAYNAATDGLKAYNAVTAWCTAHGYSS